MLEVPRSHVARAAFATAVLHGLAALGALLVQKSVLMDGDGLVMDQTYYIANHLGAWTLSWACWVGAALSIAALYTGLAMLWGRSAPWRTALAMVCLAAALSVDLTGDAIGLAILPRATETIFPTAKAVVMLLTVGVGNGLYTLAGALLVSVGARHLPWRLVAGSLAVWIPAAWLSGAALTGAMRAITPATTLTMLGIIGWTALLGRELAGGWPWDGLVAMSRKKRR